MSRIEGAGRLRVKNGGLKKDSRPAIRQESSCAAGLDKQHGIYGGRVDPEDFCNGINIMGLKWHCGARKWDIWHAPWMSSRPDKRRQESA